MAVPPVLPNLEKMNEEDTRLLRYASYLGEAYKLANPQRDSSQPVDYQQSEAFQFFGKRTQNIIGIMASAISSGALSQASNAGRQPDLSQIFSQGNDVVNVIEEARKFFNNHPDIQSALDNHEELQADLAKNLVSQERWQKWLADPARRAATLFSRAAGDYPYPPVDWVLNTLYGGCYFISTFAEKQAQKTNPLFSGMGAQKLRKASAAAASVGVVALVGFGLTAGATGAAATLAGPILIAFGSVSIMISHLISLGRSVQALVREIRSKDEAPQTYRLRVLDRLLSTLKYAASTAFYVCTAVLAVGAVVALVGTPIGLGVLAGAMATIGIVAMVASIAGGLLGDGVKRKIREIEKEAGGKIYRAESNPPQASHAYSYKAGRLLRQKSDSTINNLRGKATEARKGLEKDLGPVLANRKAIHSGYHLARHMAKHKGEGLHLHRDAITPEKFHHFAESAMAMIDAQKTEVPLYKGVKHSVVKDAKNQVTSLIIEVPKEIENAKEHLKHDRIKIEQSTAKEMEATVSGGAGDEAFFIFLDTMRNQGISHLEMDRCDDPQTVLKMLEASKLSNFNINFDPADIATLANSPNEELVEYYKKIQDMTSDEFSDYFEQRGRHKLGELPPTRKIKPYETDPNA